MAEVPAVAEDDLSFSAKDVASGLLVASGVVLALGFSAWVFAMALGLAIALVRRGVKFLRRCFRGDFD